ncbi:MAG: peptidylprolyl isomerase, partial [Candidatus Eisenbacteria bacterium]
YFSPSLARFAVVVRPTRAAADSVKLALDRGARIQAIVAADSLRGEVRSGITETRRDVGVEFRKLLFEEMRPGQSLVFGPDRTKNFAVIHLIEIVPERQLSFQEAAPLMEEAVRTSVQDTALDTLIARLAGRFKVELHPELLMRVRLTDPTVDSL